MRNHLPVLWASGSPHPSSQLEPSIVRAGPVSSIGISGHFYGFRGASFPFCSSWRLWFSFQFDWASEQLSLEIKMKIQNHLRKNQCRSTCHWLCQRRGLHHHRLGSFDLSAVCPGTHSFWLWVNDQCSYSSFVFCCSIWLTYHTCISIIRFDTRPIIIVNWRLIWTCQQNFRGWACVYTSCPVLPCCTTVNHFNIEPAPTPIPVLLHGSASRFCCRSFLVNFGPSHLNSVCEEGP